ncbi:uncharacterized protein J3R85_006734 [Psidium guajava]|nr:uncharacterized protein J3R85_006734 [Psidium guajava]
MDVNGVKKAVCNMSIVPLRIAHCIIKGTGHLRRHQAQHEVEMSRARGKLFKYYAICWKPIPSDPQRILKSYPPLREAPARAGVDKAKARVALARPGRGATHPRFGRRGHGDPC